jgi:hypothetical protein
MLYCVFELCCIGLVFKQLKRVELQFLFNFKFPNFKTIHSNTVPQVSIYQLCKSFFQEQLISK